MTLLVDPTKGTTTRTSILNIIALLWGWLVRIAIVGLDLQVVGYFLVRVLFVCLFVCL